MSLYKHLYRSLLSPMDPEKAHQLAISALSTATKIPGALATLRRMAPEHDSRLAVELWGRSFANPIGVAAGLDKEGEAIDALLALGFGHIEIGTVTLRPQSGNPRPRLFRIPEHKAIINSMGFPSKGAPTLCQRLGDCCHKGIVGINLGKNRDTPLERASEDYAALVRALADVGDYFVINVSSPNTPGLRSLQTADELVHLLNHVAKTNRQTARDKGKEPKPLLVKLSPDLPDTTLEGIAETMLSAEVSGLIATNTTTNRTGLDPVDQDRSGGLSGAPLKKRATQVVRILFRKVGNRIPIVGVGGISNAADVLERIKAGASLVQIYTAFVYGGPSLVGQILRDLSADADKHGWNSIQELVGTECHTKQNSVY
ncbi:MAG: quinone-dependent dihydroorotate dehydrogenase [Pseudomonadota bacterium]